MSNEEKILHTLDTLVLAVNSLAGQVDRLEKGQIALQEGMAAFEKRLTALEERLTALENRVEGIHNNLCLLELENKRAHGAIFDKLDVLEGKIEVNTEDIQKIKERLDADEVYIRVFDSKLRKIQG